MNLPERHLAIKVVMMPRDTNPQGTIFGGVLLSYIDQAGAIGARWEIAKAGGQLSGLVTVALHKVEFHHPVFVGDVLSFWTKLVRIGQTSITVQVSVEVEREGKTLQVTVAEVVYVAIDLSSRRPLPILPDRV